MKLLKRFGVSLDRRFWVVCIGFCGVLLLYLLLRFISIKLVPPFVDELIYVRWAQLGYFDAGKRLVSLSDGKQPLFIWLITLLMTYVPNPLVAGRLVSIGAGLGSMLGIGLCAYLLYKNVKTSLVSMALYACYPFALIHDRLAIYDSLVAFFYVWSINIIILFIRRPTLGLALVLANVLGAALLTKSTSTLFMVLIPFSLFVRNVTLSKRESLRIFLYVILIFTVSFVYSAIVQLSPEVANIAPKNLLFVRSTSEVISIQGLQSLFINGYHILLWIVSYATIPILFFAGLSMIIVSFRNKSSLFLFLCFLVPLVLISVFGRLLYPRHIFFLSIPLLILASNSCVVLLRKVKYQWKQIMVLVLLFSGVSIVDFRILSHFPSAPLPEIDRFQYIYGWPSGYGVREIIKYLQIKASQGHIVIAAEGAFGSLPKTAAELYFFQHPGVTITDFDEHVTDVIPQHIVDATKLYPVYLIFNKVQQIPAWPMTKIMEIQKGAGNEHMRLYLLNSPEVVSIISERSQ